MDKAKLQYFVRRRDKLLQKILPNSVVIIPSNDEIIRTGDGYFSFRQDSNFYYLTGFHEPSSLAVLSTNSNNNAQFLLFVRPNNPEKEQWDGKMAGLTGAKNLYQADQVIDINTRDEKMLELLQNKEHIYYSLGCNDQYDKLLLGYLKQIRAMQRKGVGVPEQVHDLNSLLFDLRVIKDELEVELMRKAAIISAAGHTKIMQSAYQYNYEYELEAEFRFECIKNGARELAYNSIVGSGENTCILHYNTNDQSIDKSGLVLIDAGAEYENYAADITRTFPANGKFSEEQRAIYQLVLEAQLAAIEEVKPDNSWDRPQQVILEIMTAGLVKLGLIKSNGKSTAELIELEAYRPFYMHKSGHFLGLDVHDVGKYKINGQWCKFVPGMVLTIEPGIYIMANLPGVDKRWWNIGVRVEDDVLVTEHGHEVLTHGVPKQIAEIEELMAHG
ncbi:MAG: aminopeptidase P N-terminal domain-containing protein [Gammaproteobacteria bacterium]|nr:aminopeptidase P N-terminal domain-containing protein [Gammaproteobacteria bacterium]